MKIGFIQFSPIFGNKVANLKKIRELISKEKADLFVLPEMCTTGYMVSDRNELQNIAEIIPDSPTVTELINVASENNCCLIAGMPEVIDGKLFSTAVAVSGNEVLAKHQKTHLFLKEKLYFDQGETRPTIFEWRGAKIGLGVCYDYMFPEFWRALALQGADIFCNTANFVFDYGFKLMQARSLENGVYSVTVNRSGEERGQTFRGRSEMVDTRGNVILKAGSEEEVNIIEVDPTESRNKKWNEYNDLFKDRRPEMY